MFSFFRRSTSLDEIDFGRIGVTSKLLVDVSISRTVSHLTCFLPENNVFCEALKLYASHGEKALKDKLHHYYSGNICLTIADVWGLKNDKLSAMPAMSVVMPWSKECPEVKISRIAIASGRGGFLSREAADLGLNPESNYGWQFFGPASSALVDLECNRLISVYESIRREGYRPSRNGHIHGYVLTDGYEKKVVIVGGKHRYAALTALGYSDIRVLIKSKVTPLCVSSEEKLKWPQVKHGLYSIDDAVSIFNRQFNGIGR